MIDNVPTNCHAIYCIRHLRKGGIYVGATTNPEGRKNTHRSQLAAGISRHHGLANEFTPFSELDFSFEVLEICQSDEAKSRESEWIDKLKANLNVQKFGGAGRPMKPGTRYMTRLDYETYREFLEYRENFMPDKSQSEVAAHLIAEGLRIDALEKSSGKSS